MIRTVRLIGSNKCPVCGKEFFATPPLRPNIEDREFYGGRIKFFKNVYCDCLAQYDLCIEKKFNSVKVAEEFNVIDMIELKRGTPLEELREREAQKIFMEAGEKTREDVAKLTEEKGTLPTLGQRKEIQRQNVLATIVDVDTKVETMCLHTVKELQTMCRKRRIKYSKNDTKQKLAQKLIAYDPSLVVAGQDD